MSRRSLLPLIAIAAIAAAARFWGLSFGLPYTQARPDETFVIDTVLDLVRGHVRHEFYDYPWLYMWGLTGLALIYFVWGLAAGTFHSIADLTASWHVHWEPFFLMSRGLSATLGTATVVVIFWIGRRLWDETTGLLAAFFLSLAFVHARDSHFGTTDVAMTFLVTVAIGLLVDDRLGRRSSFVPAGVAAGLAAATKYTAVLLAAPILTSHALHVLESPGRRLQAALDGRLLRLGIACALAFAVGVPFVFLDTERFLAAMALLQQSTARGDGLVPVEAGWLHHLRLSLWHGVGPPLLATGLAGMATILVRTPAIGALLFSFPIALFIVTASVKNEFFRYAIPEVPFLCLAAAWLVCRVAAWLAPPETGRGGRWAVWVPWLIGLAIVSPSAWSVWQFDRVMSQTDNRVVVARWFEQHVPDGSSVLQSGSRYGHVQFDRRLRYTSWNWDKAHLIFTVDNRPATGRPDWILVQESPLPSETQPIVKEYLRQGYELTQKFTALSLPGDHLFDQQDAFYVPFAGFSGVKRPGPNFSLFRRVGAAVQ